MKLVFAKEFDKRYKVLKKNQQTKIDKALVAFVNDKSVSSLRHHELKGKWRDHFSISAGGDLRIHLKYMKKESVLVVTIGTHSQLYR